MSKDIYVGVDGVARKASKLYVGVDGVARKVTKAYVGVNGVAREVYSAAAPVQRYVIGETIQWAGYEWIVVNDNGNDTVVLAMKDIYELTTFGSNNSYAGSTLAAKAQAFENSLPAYALAQAVETTVEGVTAKVFVPSTENVFNGGYPYFNSNNARLARLPTGEIQGWWTSTPSSNTTAYGITSNNGGGKETAQVKWERGFRPFITIRQPS